MKNTKDLIVSKEQHTAIIKINRPPNNFFDAELIKQIADLLENIDLDNSLRSVILCSEGKNFCAGADFSKSSRMSPSPMISKLVLIPTSAYKIKFMFFWAVIRPTKRIFLLVLNPSGRKTSESIQLGRTFILFDVILNCFSKIFRSDKEATWM